MARLRVPLTIALDSSLAVLEPVLTERGHTVTMLVPGQFDAVFAPHARRVTADMITELPSQTLGMIDVCLMGVMELKRDVENKEAITKKASKRKTPVDTTVHCKTPRRKRKAKGGSVDPAPSNDGGNSTPGATEQGEPNT